MYARLQLNMTRGATDGSFLVQQLIDMVYKQLDQSAVSNTIVPRCAFSTSAPIFTSLFSIFFVIDLLFSSDIISGVYLWLFQMVLHISAYAGVMQLNMRSLEL